MGELVEAAKALSAPATKLIEVVSRGIGRAYDPRYKKRMADASAYELDVLADAVRRNSDLPILIDRDGVQLDSRSIQELAERTKARLFSQEMRKQQNIEAIVDKAYEELKGDTVVSDEPVDDDWIVRFFNSVEDVSSEIVQNVWSRVLAGEIKRPSTFSLRTLETLKNLSQYEVELFQRCSILVLRSEAIYFLPILHELDVEYAITKKDIELLDDAGLLKSRAQPLMQDKDGYLREIRNEQIVGLIDYNHYPIPKSSSLVSFFLTNSGGELYKAIRSICNESEEFAIKYLTLLTKGPHYFGISVHKIVEINGDNFIYEDANLI